VAGVGRGSVVLVPRVVPLLLVLVGEEPDSYELAPSLASTPSLIPVTLVPRAL
jgi:hypothetical protein